MENLARILNILNGYFKNLMRGIVVAFVVGVAGTIVVAVTKLLLGIEPLYLMIFFIGLPLIGFIGKKSIDFLVKKI